MYSRSTDRGGRRIKLPPGYDGSTFRHDTGELRRLAEETEMKIHSPAENEYRRSLPQKEEVRDAVVSLPVLAEVPKEGEMALPTVPPEKETEGSFLGGLMEALGQEEWLLFLLILLLAADGSDSWDVILLLGLLLAVRETGELRV
ncbi:MAG: hypothetical protein IKV57_06750 [Clostridia bacterium]|nr:hypothetical protein [Clostridia bacterium]